MSDSENVLNRIGTGPAPAGWLTRLARRLLFTRLAGLEAGQLDWVEGGTTRCFGRASPDCPLRVRLTVVDTDCYPEVAFGGSLGAAESYIRGHWRCDDLTGLIRLMLLNRHVLEQIDSGTGRVMNPVRKLFHRMHRNTRRGSRRNIRAHYDLGNDFFRLFLDETLTYSCGIFERPDSSLREASEAKLDRICRKLDLGPEDHVLEIGTGWGSFAIHAAGRYGCRVTTTTISDAQHELARERIREAGLDHRIDVLKRDFRDLEGRFDKLVSIEMIEAVGENNLGRFFRVCADRLRPGGKMVLQSITIADALYDDYRGSVDFIQRYVFPGGFLPSVSALCQKMAAHSDLRLFHLEDIGPHYAETLRRWRQRFNDNYRAIRELGYPPEFMRLWEFYLCYCEGGFIERATGDVQLVLVKSRDRSPSLLTV
jgi:cyclopropane-fatty-acyl-phospholipid synthase